MMAKFVREHVYSPAERESHLLEFIASAELLLASSVLHQQFPERVATISQCLEIGKSLARTGFHQDELSTLSREWMPVLCTYRDWMPPLEQTDEGKWREPEWYPAFEKMERRATHAAERLRQLGELHYE